jgi:phage-related protein
VSAGQGCRWREQRRQNKQPNRNHQGTAHADKMTKSTQELSSQRCSKFFHDLDMLFVYFSNLNGFTNKAMAATLPLLNHSPPLSW